MARIVKIQKDVNQDKQDIRYKSSILY